MSIVAGGLLSLRRRLVSSCGIVGYLGKGNAYPFLKDGIQILQNRGYDSVGISTIDSKGKLKTTKFASQESTSDCVDRLLNNSSEHDGDSIGIAHTRWATHGGKTQPNAHPHTDWKNRVAIVHNGTITNFASLKKELQDKGIPFVTQTDTEVIVNLIGDNLEGGHPFHDAVIKAIARLQGTWGLVAINKENPDSLVLSRNGSPLLVGENDQGVYVASEQTPLRGRTDNFVALNDGETVVASLKDGLQHLNHRKEQVTGEQVLLTPAPFGTWTEKEMYEQPRSLARALNHGARLAGAAGKKIKLGGLDANANELLSRENLIITGCGTSLNAGLYVEELLEALGCFRHVNVVEATDVAPQGDLSDTTFLAITQSGETLDVIRAVSKAKERGGRVMSVVNAVGSLVARTTGMGVYLNSGREVAVASTKAFTSQVTVLALIAAWFAERKGIAEENKEYFRSLLDALHTLPVYAGMTLQCRDQCKDIAKELKHQKSMFVLGKGASHAVALEGALKIKEISYMHAEGFKSAALKHGPFALIDAEDKTPVIMVAPQGNDADWVNTAHQVKARGATLICITDEPTLFTDVADHIVVIPRNGPLTALLAVIPLQLLAYFLAIERGVNPDKPRGLAKTVTVN